MLDRGPSNSRLVAQVAPGIPVDRYVVGKPVEEVVTLLPRLFNLCRGAQSVAVEAALGRPTQPDAIARDILRDHLLKFHVTWPGFFGLAPGSLPEDWTEGGAPLLRSLFGADSAPRTPSDFWGFLDTGTLLAETLRRIAAAFAPGEAQASGLEPVTLQTIWDVRASENSVAGRHSDHPVMRDIADSHGRGPLWRAAARLYDLEAAATNRLPNVEIGPGSAMVPAARGAYAVYIETDRDRVTEFHRVTPTDSLLASGGVLERSLKSLPASKAGLGGLLLEILDPCVPVRLKETADA